MNRKQLVRISEEQYDKLDAMTWQVLEDTHALSIHRFRVEYKKLRAYFRMLSLSENGRDKLRCSRQLKKAFAIAGAVRDLQLQQRRILQATRFAPKPPRVYLNVLQQRIDQLQYRLTGILSGNPVKHSRKKTTPLLPERFNLAHFRQFVAQKWEVVFAIMNSRKWSDNNIHLIRKNFKDLYYAMKYYTGLHYQLLTAAVWKGKDESWFEQILDELGAFQDRRTSIALLKAVWLNKFDVYNKQLLERVKKDWIRDKTVMKQKLLQKLVIHLPSQQRAVSLS